MLVAEGVGGLLVPLTAEASVRDLAVELRLPLVVAARPGLGTISHTLLTVEAARAAGLRVAARRAHAVAGGAERDGGVQPRDDRAPRPRRGRDAGRSWPTGAPRPLAAGGAALPVAGWLD